MVRAMASPSRTAEREEERRLNLRTLVIASAASATAAVVTSQLWIAGTWIAAAMTPVLVTLVSEMLHRPTEKIAQRLTTSERTALLAEAAGPGRRPRRDADRLPERAESEPGSGEPLPGESRPGVPVREPGQTRFYRSSATPRRRRIAVGAVLTTSALALLIAVVALTVPELVAGGSIGKGDGRTTLFSPSKKKSDSSKEEEKPTETEQRQEQEQEQPAATEQETAPQQEQLTETTPEEELPTETTPPPATPLPQTTPAPPAQP
jgi:hypothetical protein